MNSSCSSSHGFCLCHEAQWNSHQGFHLLLLTALCWNSGAFCEKSFANEPRKERLFYPHYFMKNWEPLSQEHCTLEVKIWLKKFFFFFLNVHLKLWTKSTWIQRVSQTGKKHVWNKSTILLLLVVPKWEKNLNNVNVGGEKNQRKNFHSTWMKNLIEVEHLIAFCFWVYNFSCWKLYLFNRVPMLACDWEHLLLILSWQ